MSTFSSVPSTVLTRRRHAALAPARGGARGRAGGTALGAPGDAPGDARADYAAWEASARRPPHRARDMPYGNAGVMLINVPWMRRTYDEFVAWAFSDANAARGLHFGPYGPGDQGAYNEFYSGKFVVHRWPLFNWKPYWGFNARAKLVHFHGPKPDDYVVFRQSGVATHTALTVLLNRCREPTEEHPGRRAHGCFRYTEQFLQWREYLRAEGS